MSQTTADQMRRLSHSTIDGLLDKCAYRVGLERIVRLPSPGNARTAAGTAYHAGIEAHEKARQLWYRSHGAHGSPNGCSYADAVNAALRELYDKVAVADGLSEEETLEAAHQITTALHHWFETPIPEGQPGAGGTLRDRVLDWVPVAVEQPWRLWMSDRTSLPIVGAADAVYRTPEGELVIVDHKSAGNFGKYRLDGSGQVDQGAMYALAVMRSTSLPGTGDEIPRVEFHVARIEAGSNARFEGVRVVTLEVAEYHLDYIEGRVELAHDTALEGRFEKNPDTWLCSPKWCPFHVDAGGPCDPHGPPEYDLTEGAVTD